jgi:Flp pilus assembly pilin Flp
MLADSRTSSVTAAQWRLARSTARLLRRLAVETDGQDMIEYALVTTFIGFAGAAAWNATQTGLGNAYSGFNDAVWDLWEPADPVGGGS